MLDNELDITGDRDFSALRTTHELGAKLGELDVEVLGDGRKNVGMLALSCHHELGRGLRTRLDLENLAGLDAERRTVYKLAVDEDVTVNDNLASLGDRAGKTGAKNEGVKTHLKQLDEVLTRHAFHPAGLVQILRS